MEAAINALFNTNTITRKAIDPVTTCAYWTIDLIDISNFNSPFDKEI
jgi:hypothetical protein